MLRTASSLFKRGLPGIRRVAALLLIVACAPLCGCTNFGATRLYQDQLGYSEALGDSQKAQALLNVVRLRYAEAPVFLNTTQVIAGYTLQQSLTGTLTLLPGNGAGNTVAGTPGVTLSQTPTFTFQPVAGEALAESFIRPLAPAELLPLSLSGLPIDVLFRLAVQSVNGLDNRALLDARDRSASPAFARLLVDLRLLQVASLIGVHLDPGGQLKDPKAKLAGRLVLTVAEGRTPGEQALVARTRATLGMTAGANEAEVIYGPHASAPGQVAILTRSVLGILAQVAAEVDVPPDDVASGRTLATVKDEDILRRPTVIVRSGIKLPADTFASVRYHDKWYWIANTDFDSKLAFSVLQILMSLAETTQAPDTIVTIPAR